MTEEGKTLGGRGGKKEAASPPPSPLMHPSAKCSGDAVECHVLQRDSGSLELLYRLYMLPTGAELRIGPASKHSYAAKLHSVLAVTKCLRASSLLPGSDNGTCLSVSPMDVHGVSMTGHERRNLLSFRDCATGVQRLTSLERQLLRHLIPPFTLFHSKSLPPDFTAVFLGESRLFS